MRSPFFWTGLLKLFAPRDDHASSGVFVILTANEDVSDLFMFSLMALLCLELQTASAKEKFAPLRLDYKVLFLLSELLKLRARTKMLHSLLQVGNGCFCIGRRS